MALDERDFLLNGEIFRPDRIFKSTQNKYTIIDYKTGKKESKHRQQILSYKNNLQQLGCEVENCYLVYIDNEIDILEVY